MTDRPPLVGSFDAKKHAYRQTQDGVVISFVVDPADITPEFAAAPLGTTLKIGYAEYDSATGEAKEAPRPKRERLISERLALACRDWGFWRSLEAPGCPVRDVHRADEVLKIRLGIESKTECDVPGEKQDAAKRLLDDYELKRKYPGNLEREAGKHG